MDAPLTLRRRLRRALAQLRGPRRTLLPWVHGTAGGPLVFGMRGVALGEQDPARVHVGSDVVIGDDVQFHIGPHGRVEIGDGTVLGGGCMIAADEVVSIGAGCRIGRGAAVTDTWSYGRDVPRAPAPRAVRIGDGATVGPNSTVGPGASLPAGSSVPAGSTVHPWLEEA